MVLGYKVHGDDGDCHPEKDSVMLTDNDNGQKQNRGDQTIKSINKNKQDLVLKKLLLIVVSVVTIEYIVKNMDVNADNIKQIQSSKLQ